jgi:hypothetical protein
MDEKRFGSFASTARTSHGPTDACHERPGSEVAIRNEFLRAKIIILTTYESDVQDAMKLDARAYLLKTQLDKELLGTIRAVQAGK